MSLPLLSDIANYNIYAMPNTTGEVMWSCNVTAIENEREKCKSSVFRKERSFCTRSISLLR